MLWPTCDLHRTLVLGLWLKREIHRCKNSLRLGVMKLSPTWSNVCEKQPMSTINGYTTFTVCIAKLLTDARSLIAARSSSDFTLYFSTLMSSLATSSPVMDFASICMRINCCSRFHSSLTKRTVWPLPHQVGRCHQRWLTDACLWSLHGFVPPHVSGWMALSQTCGGGRLNGMILFEQVPKAIQLGQRNTCSKERQWPP